MKLLKDHLSLNASTVTGIISRLETKGLIARLPSPGDRRSTPIVLTSKGHELINKTDESLHERMSSRANKIQDQDFDQILVSFETVIDLFDINDIDASPIISGQTEM
jgi:DNA-binding MarR family transcriptional regulator